MTEQEQFEFEKQKALALAEAEAGIPQKQEDPSVAEKVADTALGVVGGVGKVFDYIPGGSRTAIQKGADVISGTDSAGTVEQALSAEAQGWGEYLNKRGVPEMGSVDLPVPTEYLRKKLGETLHLTGRGALGMGADILSDPVVLGSIAGTVLTGGGAAPLVAPVGGARLLQLLSRGAKSAAATAKVMSPTGIIGKVAESAPALRAAAELQSAKALGATDAMISKFGMNKIKEAGAHGLDEKIVTPFASTDTKIARNKAIMDEAIQGREGVVNKIDESGQTFYKPSNVASELEAKHGGNYEDPAFKSTKNLYTDIMESIRKRDPSLSEAQVAKEAEAKVLQRPIENEYFSTHPSTPEQIGMNTKPIISIGEDASQVLNTPVQEGFFSEQYLNSLKGKKGQVSLNLETGGNPIKVDNYYKVGTSIDTPSQPAAPFSHTVQEPLPLKYENAAPLTIRLQEGQKLQKVLDTKANWNKPKFQEVTESERLARDSSRINRAELNRAAEEGANAIGAPGEAKLVTEGNRKYSIGDKIDTMLEKKASKELGNKPFTTLLTTAMATVGSHNIPEALMRGGAALAANVVGNKYGRNLLATGLNTTSKGVAKVAPYSKPMIDAINKLPPEVWAKILEGQKQNEAQ